MKEINVIYPAHPGAASLHYEGPEGKVWMSPSANPNMPNIFNSWYAGQNPGPNDGVLLTEPIVVHPLDYDIDFLMKFKKVYGCFERAFENTPVKDKFITINYGSVLCPENVVELRKRWLSWSQRIPGVVIVSGGKDSTHHASIYNLRLKLADMFYEAGLPVAWFGCMPNCTRPYFRGTIQDKIGEICKYRFHVCSENTYDPTYSYNYMTEKLPHAMYGGSVGLYMGCYNIDDLVPKDTFFDLRPYFSNGNIDNRLVNDIKNYREEEFNKYQEAAYQFMLDPQGLFYHTDMRRYYKKMLETL